jgi:GNAT superfamily N-acetyltransferase
VIARLDLPDVPRWIEAHGIAADPANWQRTLGNGLAVGSDVARLVVVVGDADAAAVAALAHEVPRHTMLFAIERADLAAASRRAVVRAFLHTLPDASALPVVDGAAPLPAEITLGHVPAPLAEELAAVRAHRTLWAALVAGVPVSFAYAPWRSARWFDVSVDTLPEARQLGLGRIVATAMIEDERAQGREPVWGTGEGNLASLRLAEGLGFVKIDELWVAT